MTLLFSSFELKHAAHSGLCSSLICRSAWIKSLRCKLSLLNDAHSAQYKIDETHSYLHARLQHNAATSMMDGSKHL